MKLTLPSAYVAQAAEAMRSASQRIYLLSMVLADHENTRELVDALKSAAHRGVEVIVAADVFTYGEVSGGFLPVRYYSKDARATNQMVKALRKAGVKFHWLGRGRITLFNGRTHSKWCIIDDVVFSFGGVNMYSQGIENVDYMFRVEDKKIADRLADEQRRIQTAERRASNFPSVTVELDQVNILLDGGIIGQSILYRRACELAEQASKIVFVSQYCPTGKLSRILKKADATLYFNQPSQADGLNKFVIRTSQFLSGLKTSYTRERYLHAKFILFTLPDGTKTAISGSHNFAYTGVLLGTREVGIETKDPSIIKQLESFVKQHVA
ncbi:phospholipase D-like domain-containing protein [Candidatus Saccharibacteria bacterium]|nr:phospholipase D-like domain-containing protein [Candidatus Saccharibacteria bacterium]